LPRAYIGIETLGGLYEELKKEILRKKLVSRAFTIFGYYDLIAETMEFSDIKELQTNILENIEKVSIDGESAILSTSTYMVLQTHFRTDTAKPFAFCFLKLMPPYKDTFEILKKVEGISRESLVLGDYDIILEIEAENLQEAAKVIKRIYKTARRTVSTCTYICLSSEE
jgi:DNA-binding Lrp family transcriptional regulator